MLATRLDPTASLDVVAGHADPEPALPVARSSIRWTWPVAALLFVQYTVVGWWLLDVRHFVISDAISRTLSAKLMVLSRDPHLGAVGFYWMPIPTLARVPFVLVAQLAGKPVLAGPLTSAAFAALTVPVLVAIGRTLCLSSPVVALVTLSYALSPTTVFIGANGMSESAFAFFLAVCVLGYLRWHLEPSVARLALFGLSLAGAMACRYETLLILPVAAFAVAVGSPRGMRLPCVTVAMLPPAGWFFWWALASKLILGDWLFWFHASKATTATPPDAEWVRGYDGLGGSLTYSALLTVVLAPAVLALLAGFAATPRRWRGWVAIIGFVVVIPAFIALQLAQRQTWAVPRFFATTPLLAAAGALWGFYALAGRAPLTVALRWAGVLLVPVGAVTGTLFLADPHHSYAEGEFVLLRPLLGREAASNPVDGTGPNRIFMWEFGAYDLLMDDLEPRLARGEKVAMDSLQAVPPVLTMHPGQFIVPEDRDFEQVVADPEGRFDLIVIQPWIARTAYRTELDRIIETSDGGSWRKIASYGRWAELYEFFPDVTPEAPGG